MADKTVIAAGHLCLDIIPGFSEGEDRPLSELFAPGRLINIEKASLASGGAVSNTGIALAKLGIDAVLMGKVGADPFGKLLEGLVSSKGARPGIIVSEKDSTSYTIVLNAPGYDRILLHNTGANDTYCADDPDYGAVRDAALFHFGYPPLMKRMYENGGAELTDMFRKVKGCGVATSLDMSLPDPKNASGKADWLAVLEKTLPYVDIFAPSAEEIIYMADKEEYRKLSAGNETGDFTDSLRIDALPAIGEKLIGMGAAVVAVKCGKKGLYLKTASKERLSQMGKAWPDKRLPADMANIEIFCESYRVEPVCSAAGSGDNCIAGLLAAFLKGMKAEDCAKVGCVVGAQNLRAYDAVSGVRDWDETMRQLGSGMERNRLNGETRLWEFDETVKLWRRQGRNGI